MSSDGSQSSLAKALLEKTLMRDWLGPRLKAAKIRQSDLARFLDVREPTVTQWLNGDAAIPAARAHEIAMALSLSPQDFLDMTAITACSVCFDVMTRELMPQDGASHEDQLLSYVRRPFAMLEGLVQFAAKRAEDDTTATPNASVYANMLNHLRCARRSIDDINAWLGSKTEHILTAENIDRHLRYPMNYYLGFVLVEVTPIDGPGVQDLHDDIVSDLLQCVRGAQVDEGPEHRISLHAIHLMSRYRPAACDVNLRQMMRDRNISTRRMATFGRVFGADGKAVLEQVTDHIMKDDKFASAVTAFDGLHYGDYSRFSEIENPDIVPANAFLRHLQGILSADEVVRQVAAVRILRLLERYSRRLIDVQKIRYALMEKNQAVEHCVVTTSEQTASRDQLLKLVRDVKAES